MCIVDCKSYSNYRFCQDYHSCTTEHVSGHLFGEIREVDLADLKQEPDDVCCVLFPIYQFATTDKTVLIIGDRSRF